MAILYDVPAGKTLTIEGPCTATIKGASGHPTLDDAVAPPPERKAEPDDEHEHHRHRRHER